MSPIQKLILYTLIPALLLVLTSLGDIPIIARLTYGISLIDTMFHEIGHTIFSWAFGYPALPSFDLEHGGGMSYYFDREWILQFCGFGAAAYGCYWLYDDLDRRACVVGGIVTALYVFTALTGLHHVVIDFMGHGFAILTGSFFLLRAFMGWTKKRLGEKWISAFLGYFILFANTKLAWKLIFDIDYKEEYWNQKGQHGFGDFSKIADYFWFKSEVPVAWFCLLLCVILLILPHFLCWRESLYQETTEA